MNRSLFDLFFSLAHQNALLDGILYFLGVYVLYFGMALFGLFIFFISYDWRVKIIFALQGILVVILGRGIFVPFIRFLYEHPRPFHALGIEPLFLASDPLHSFPSGHAAFLFALATIVFFVSRKWGAWMFAVAILNTAARVISGVHWPFDIIGGMVTGVLSAVLVYALVNPYFEEVRKKIGSEEFSEPVR